MGKCIFCSVLLIFCSFSLPAQVVKSVVLDSVMIQSVKQGFDVEDFIDMVKQDTSFLKGFRTLRNSPHKLSSEFKVYNRSRSKIKSSRKRNGTQLTSESRRWVRIEMDKTTGKFYNRKRIPHMYTAELFDELFYYTDTLDLVDLKSESNYNFDQSNKSNIDKLKQMVFNPASDIKGVPVVGNRLSVFSDELSHYYDYRISSKVYNDSIPCYVFTCSVKEDAGSYPVLQYLNTWFDKRTFSIIYRDYHYLYSGLLFEFDVTIKVKMKYGFGKLYPETIQYSGYWDVPLKKQETVDFKVSFELEQ